MAFADTPPWLSRYESGKYQPVTFLERGVALPFTTPALLGGRIRPGRKAAELVLANPAGAEGVYILSWASLPDVCTPTLHDRALWGRVAQLAILTPGTVRQASRAVAAEGLAGRAAARAAAEAERQSRRARTITHYHLLVELVRQDDPGSSRAASQPWDPAVLEERARAALSRRRGSNSSAASAFEALAELAELFEACGLPDDPSQARMPQQAAEIQAVVQAMIRWSERATATERSCTRLLAECASLTQRCFQHAMTEAHALLADLSGLVERWQRGQDPIANIAARPEWLLDGWELICGLWRGAAEEQRATALLDMAALVPVVPREVGDWIGFDAAGAVVEHRSGLRQWRRMVQPNQDWTTGRILELVARNEAVRVQCA
ncbi:hypothetical protein [Roseicella aquatilis]|uniref:Uncharacterized protein n=1 Tax=Roseicella aquatilis TaxID=2527868 RepID=A0A4R4DVA9_9PROT|nr:hypothetical protein [Roseicella aquatilis]TCZ64403.1 hypothetical protein EXY23_07080 [Roseicella aquatilis]